MSEMKEKPEQEPEPKSEEEQEEEQRTDLGDMVNSMAVEIENFKISIRQLLEQQPTQHGLARTFTADKSDQRFVGPKIIAQGLEDFIPARFREKNVGIRFFGKRGLIEVKMFQIHLFSNLIKSFLS